MIYMYNVLFSIKLVIFFKFPEIESTLQESKKILFHEI